MIARNAINSAIDCLMDEVDATHDLRMELEMDTPEMRAAEDLFDMLSADIATLKAMALRYS